MADGGRRLTAPRVSAARWPRTARVVVLLLVDGLAIFAASAIAYLLWALPVHGQLPSLYLQLLPLLPAFFLSNALWGLYPGFGAGAVETLRRLCLSSSAIFLVLAAVSFALKVEPIYSRMTFGLAWLFTLVLLPLLRFGLLSAAQHWRWWGEPCVVVGTGELARRTVEALEEALSLGYRPAAVLRLDDQDGGDAAAGLPTLASAPGLAATGMRVALVADPRLEREPERIDALRHDFRHVVLIRDHASLPVDGLEVHNFGAVIGVEFVNQLRRRRNRALKRGLDLTLGSVLLVLTTPLLLGAAALMRFRHGRPVFYRQLREGRGGKLFDLVKLRTMHTDAEARLERYLETNPEAREEWEYRHKLVDDPRVLPAGRFLRRWSLDELPQLWHVVRGQMSLVGPRPFPDYHLERLPERFRELRRRVRPGLTGLWQVMVRGDGGSAEQQSYDAYYIRNWSPWLDLYVLGKTLAAVLRGRGAF